MALTSSLDAVLSDFEVAWRSGRGARSEEWLARLDAGNPADETELIYHEFCLAEADGLNPDPKAYLARFPDHRGSLARLFALHAVASLGDPEGPDDLPVAGDEVGPYRLVRELGTGTFARVFLAEQADLDGRHVVVKVTARPSPEPRLLARAGHAHIVPVLRQATTDDGALQVVTMPFLGGATLAAVSTLGGPRPRTPRSGRDFLARLDLASAPEYPRADVPRPAREILARLSYPRAIAYLFARLAEALDHAHRRGVAHGDIKPTNILLTADGLPMLFDFNLAVDWHAADAPRLGGGTLAYMPPERLLAIAGAGPDAAGSGAPPDRHRADLYSLGLVLIEALTGVTPAVPEAGGDGSVSVRSVALGLAEARAGGVAAFPDWARLPVPAGLRPIVAHCLEADPARRYADGRSLAEDLDRWRSDLAPVTATDGRWPVPLTRWARRRRISIAAGLLTVAAATAAGTLVASRFQSGERAEAAAKYAAFLDGNEPGVLAFREFGSWSPRPGDPAEVATRKLKVYRVVDDPAWRLRADVRGLPPNDRDDLELLMLEQVFRLAVSLSDRPDSPGDWRRGLALLDRERRVASARGLDLARGVLAAKLGDAGPAPRGAEPPGWVGDYLRGVEAEADHARVALGHYEAAAAARPELFWPHYRAAAAATRLSRYEAACSHLKAAMALRPENAALSIQLASMLLLDRKPEEALDACDRAIAIDPDFTEAYGNRAIVADRLARADGPRRDADRFAVLTRYQGPAEAERLDFRSLLHRMHQGRDDEPRREEGLRKILAVDPANTQARLERAVRLGRSDRWGEAIPILDEVLAAEPGHLHARYIRATFLRLLGRPEAYPEFAALIDHPRFEELYREDPQVAFLFPFLTGERLRQGRVDEARAFAERGVASSARGNPYPGESAYALARVDAASGDLDRARDRLRGAVDIQPGLGERYAGDFVFAGLRRADPGFLKTRPGSVPAPALPR